MHGSMAWWHGPCDVGARHGQGATAEPDDEAGGDGEGDGGHEDVEEMAQDLNKGRDVEDERRGPFITDNAHGDGDEHAAEGEDPDGQAENRFATTHRLQIRPGRRKQQATRRLGYQCDEVDDEERWNVELLLMMMRGGAGRPGERNVPRLVGNKVVNGDAEEPTNARA